MRRTLLALLLAAPLALSARSARATGHKLRIATMAPKSSSWGKLFSVWQRAVDKKTHGRLALTVYYNGVQGSDDTMVGKMRSGQLDGAALTSVGLSRIYRDVMVLQLPGVVDSWAELDKVRAGLGPDLEKGFEKKGFHLLGWGDVGLVRQMSHGFAVHRPSDLHGHHPVMWQGEPMAPLVYSSIGQVVPVALGPMEVLPALRAHKVDVVNAPSLAAEQLQWTPYLDHIASTVSVCAIGGTVIRQKALDDLPADLRKTFFELEERLQKLSKHRVRQLDAASYKRLVRRMQVVSTTPADQAAWRKVLVRAVQRLAQGTYDPALIKRVLAITGKH
jgi:TRAP-type C4-dicarboxylate transport system substrate-binding protein